MAIKSVNGQSVYVIESRPVDAAKTSTGVGYAQLVSQLRWQIWEQAEKQILRELEFDKLGYQAQLDAYVKQKQELTRSLAKAQDLKEKVKRGDVSVSAAISAAKGDYAAEAANQRNRIRFGTEKVSERETADILGQPTGQFVRSYSYTGLKPGQEPPKDLEGITSRIGRISKQLGVDTPEDRKQAAIAAADAEAKKLSAEWMTGFKTNNPSNLSEKEWGSSPEGADIEKRLGDAFAELNKLKATPASQFPSAKDAKDETELDDFVSQLQAEIDALEAPRIGFDTNVLSRTREQFGGMAGVGGFGFARRPSKTSPIYDEGRAREALGRQDAVAQEFISTTAEAQKKAAEDAVLKAKESSRQKRIIDLEAFDPAGVDTEVQAQLKALKETPASLTEIEKDSIASKAIDDAMAAYREEALLAGPGERTAGTFMDIPRAEPTRKDPFVKDRRRLSDLDIFKSYVGVPAVDAAGFQFGGQGPVEPEAVVPKRFETPPIKPATPPGTTSRPPNLQELVEGVKPYKKSYPDLGTDPEQLEPRGKPKPPAPEGGREDLGEGMVYDPVDKIIFGKDGFPLFVLTPPINQNEAAPKPTVVTEAELAKKLEELRKKAKGGASKSVGQNRQEKYAAANLKAIKAGSDLANKPAKLMRIAKLDLPEKERAKIVPEHILLVDKIYGINKGKVNAYKATYDEIARVYGKDEKRRKEAQEYLTATHLLYSEGLA